MSNKKGKEQLGLGIKALLSKIDDTHVKVQGTSKNQPTPLSQFISIDSIVVNPHQPRKHFDEQELEDLANSIKTYGLIQPITVRKLTPTSFQIISGERRWRAAKLAELKQVPAYIRSTDDQGLLEMAIIENIQRADLNPLEIALSFQNLIDECGLTHQDLSERIGKKRSSITNYLRLLRLPPTVQKAVSSKFISFGHAKLIAGIEQPEKQLYVLDKTIAKGLSVRNVEELIKSLENQSSKNQKVQSNPNTDYSDWQTKLSESLGAEVSIQHQRKGNGKLLIYYANDDQLQDIVDFLLAK